MYYHLNNFASSIILSVVVILESYWQYQQSLRSLSDVSSYGNPGISSGVGDCEGGVIGFGVSVGVGVFVVTFFIVFGIPHIFDSVVLTNLSFGLLGSHIFDFSAGETVVLVDDGEVIGDGVTWAWPSGATLLLVIKYETCDFQC